MLESPEYIEIRRTKYEALKAENARLWETIKVALYRLATADYEGAFEIIDAALENDFEKQE